jgi:fatty-acyl-CoA synthase
VSALRAWARALDYTKRASNVTLPGLVDQLAQTHGERAALLGSSETLTYADLAARANRYARWASDRRLKGDTVGLLLQNCPDYVAIWLGLTRAGCKVALLNTQLRRDALAHCLKVAGATHVIAATDLTSHRDSGRSHELNDLIDTGRTALSELWEWPQLAADVARLSSAPVTDQPPLRPEDTALLIYTSGTTGLPKAARITHRRITEWSFWFAGMVDAKPDDRLYNCLPMYHSVGGIVAVGSMLVAGGSVVIRERFSANQFWADVARSRCTIFQYIGELCRYLTSRPSEATERQHHLRLAVGNGLQADIWKTFQARFGVTQILEFYAATEGNVSFYNCEGVVGSIGRIPPALEPYFRVKLIRVNPESGEPARDKSGFCVVCPIGEAGEAIGEINATRRFDGYIDPEASSQKVITDVFTRGDRWFRTGDLMRRDAAGFFFFVDRLGDTFRWKGENVSTTEVAAAVRGCPGVLDAIVYGVEVPGHEGRAGMAAITAAEDFAMDRLPSYLQQVLPDYARPMFVRLCPALDVTGTFKLAKGRLAAEGYLAATDPVWRMDRGGCERLDRIVAPS